MKTTTDADRFQTTTFDYDGEPCSIRHKDGRLFEVTRSGRSSCWARDRAFARRVFQVLSIAAN